MARFMVGSWLVAIFILVTVFGGIIKSSFTVTTYDRIDTIDDLLRRPDIKPMTLKGESSEADIKVNIFITTLII